MMFIIELIRDASHFPSYHLISLFIPTSSSEHVFFPPAPLSIAFQSHSPAFLRLMYLPHFISPDLHAGKFTQTLRFSSQTVPRNWLWQDAKVSS